MKNNDLNKIQKFLKKQNIYLEATTGLEQYILLEKNLTLIIFELFKNEKFY